MARRSPTMASRRGTGTPSTRGSARNAMRAAASDATGPADPHRDTALHPCQESQDAPGDAAPSTAQTWRPIDQSPFDGLWFLPQGAPAGRPRPSGAPANRWGQGQAQTSAEARPRGWPDIAEVGRSSAGPANGPWIRSEPNAAGPMDR